MAIHLAQSLVRLPETGLPVENQFDVSSITPAAERPAIYQSRRVESPHTPRPVIRAQAPLRNNDRVFRYRTGPLTLRSAFRMSFHQIYDFRLRETVMRVPQSMGTLFMNRTAHTLVPRYTPPTPFVPVEPARQPVWLPAESVPQVPVEWRPQVLTEKVSRVTPPEWNDFFRHIEPVTFEEPMELEDSLPARFEAGPSEVVVEYNPEPTEIDDVPTAMEIDSTESVSSSMEIDSIEPVSSSMEIDSTESVSSSMEIDDIQSVSENMDMDMDIADEVSTSMDIDSRPLWSAPKPAQTHLVIQSLAPRQGFGTGVNFSTPRQPVTFAPTPRDVLLPLGQFQLPQPFSVRQSLTSVPGQRALPHWSVSTRQPPSPTVPALKRNLTGRASVYQQRLDEQLEQQRNARSNDTVMSDQQAVVSLAEASRHPLPYNNDSEWLDSEPEWEFV
jgi:hypothetical protein